jgi:hypothetical protein
LKCGGELSRFEAADQPGNAAFAAKFEIISPVPKQKRQRSKDRVVFDARLVLNVLNQHLFINDAKRGNV